MYYNTIKHWGRKDGMCMNNNGNRQQPPSRPQPPTPRPQPPAPPKPSDPSKVYQDRGKVTTSGKLPLQTIEGTYFLTI